MPPAIKISKQKILDATLSILLEKEISEINTRNIAKEVGCSTHPIYRVYQNMEELKKELKLEVDKIYNDFVGELLIESNYLFSISYSYIKFAQSYPNYFGLLFITGAIGKRNIDQIIASSWNQDTLNAMQNQYQITKEKAEKIYRDIRFYTHGIATQVFANTIELNDEMIFMLLNEQINIQLMR